MTSFKKYSRNLLTGGAMSAGVMLTGCAGMPTTPPAPVYAQPILLKAPNGQVSMLGANLNEGSIQGRQTTWFSGPVDVSAVPVAQTAATTTTTVPVTTVVDVKKEVKGHYVTEQVGTGADCATKRVWVGDHFIVVPATVVVPETVSVPAAPVAPVQNGNMAPATVTQTQGAFPIVGGTVAALLSGAGDAASGSGAILYALHYKPDNVSVSANNSGVSATGGSATGGSATGGAGGSAKATGGAGGSAVSTSQGGSAVSKSQGGDAISNSTSNAQSNSISKATATNTNTNDNYNQNQNYNNNYNQNQNYNNNNNENWNTNKNTLTNTSNPKPPQHGGGGGCPCDLSLN